MDTFLLHQLISDLHNAIESGNEEDMYRCAYSLKVLFENELPVSVEGYEAVLLRFKVAAALVEFYMARGEISCAGSLRNRIVAHYQSIRKTNEYSVGEKHEFKEILKNITATVPRSNNKSRPIEEKSSEEYKRFVFHSRALKWFAEMHGMLEEEGLEYLMPFRIDECLDALSLTMPKTQVVEEMTKYCYEKGGPLAPRSLQKHYSVNGRPATHLYVIGNGFDRHHDADSSYLDFRNYLQKRSPETVMYFDLYFGPRSLARSLVTNWSLSHLWLDFETNLSELNREKIFDTLDMALPRVDEGEGGFSYAQYFAPLDEISAAVHSVTYEMKYHFHRWVNTLHYAKGFKNKMLDLDKEAIFLNFNYTLFLESVYGVPVEQICYIHGNRKDSFGSLVLGHHSDDKEAFKRWKHKNQNRRRYRHVQKDKKGRYFANDKLAYLAFFHKDDWTGNWRLPIRYYAVDAAEERLEGYYNDNFKNTRKIIDSHMGFFDSLSAVEKITIIGCSLGSVDMDYYRQLRKSVKQDALWEISYHSEKDQERIRKFCKELDINAGCIRTFQM